MISAADILTAYAYVGSTYQGKTSHDLHKSWYDNEVRLAFHPYLCCVFLTSSDYQVLALCAVCLVGFYSQSYDGHEGTLDELREVYDADWHDEDKQYLLDILESDAPAGEDWDEFLNQIRTDVAQGSEDE